jgi:hypothetical protein
MVDITANEEYIIPELQITITTYELIGDKWIASISHTFHAHDQETLFKLIEAHKTTDTYFKSSFDGIFYYHGGIIYLRNSEAKVQYP